MTEEAWGGDLVSPKEAREFRDQFTIFPDTGITQLHCCRCDRAWNVGYHPSLDVLIEQARRHNGRVDGPAACRPAGREREPAAAW